MRKKLTSRTIETLATPFTRRKEVWDELLPGFGIRVSASGRKTFFAMGRVSGRQVRCTIGTYPTVTLAEAREAARCVLRDMQLGKYAVEVAVEKPVTLGELIPEFIAKYAKPKNRGWRESERILQRFNALHARPLATIKRADVVAVLDKIIEGGAPVRANRSLAALKKLFAWAMDRGLIDVHPIAGLKAPSREQSRDRILTDQEVVKFWRATFEVGPIFGPFYRLLVLTGQRRGEVATMRWSQIDWERRVWTIPAEIAKNGRVHEVPFGSIFSDELQEIPRLSGSAYVFSTTGGTPISGFGRTKARLDAIMGIDDWRVHDLRRTVASGMARQGVSPHVIEKLLNHVSGTISGVAAVYNRHGYEAEKREALERWEKVLIDKMTTCGLSARL